MAFEDAGTLNGFLEHNINKALDLRHDYDTLIHYARLIYTSITEADQKEFKHIKKIIMEYDKDIEMQRKARLLKTIHSDPEASYEYLTRRDRDQQLIYDQDFENAVHSNMSAIIEFFGTIMNRYTSEESVMP